MQSDVGRRRWRVGRKTAARYLSRLEKKKRESPENLAVRNRPEPDGSRRSLREFINYEYLRAHVYKRARPTCVLSPSIVVVDVVVVGHRVIFPVSGAITSRNVKGVLRKQAGTRR